MGYRLRQAANVSLHLSSHQPCMGETNTLLLVRFCRLFRPWPVECRHCT
ncbi:hypothetical protein C4K03_0656 [Pseudomonas synxantha]|uniref:Uncharacterized protein n=1 Tax=Pseudomonas synxantha TaxID=47883 RepID=A0A3G7U0P0_9PSED|nr:hypothetical protein C4K03_0656 [Pseudomonas synxantha]